jgi:uridine kinase
LDIAGDDMHKWERNDPHWSALTHLNPAANNLHDELGYAMQLKRGENIVRRFYDHALGKFTAPKNVKPKKIIVFQGLHTLYLPKTRAVFDLKVFLAPEEDLRKKWKIVRDVSERGYSEDVILKNIKERSYDATKYIQEQEKYAHIVISVKGSNSQPALDVICDNSFNLDPFIMVLESANLNIIHEHEIDMQKLCIKGVISAEEIERIAYVLVPEVWEINQREREWQCGLNGVLQIMLAYLIFHKAKLDHDLV